MTEAEDRATAIQLSLIRDVAEILGNSGIPHWLFGGWGVDFLVGAIIRAHADVEFLIWQHDAKAVGVLLELHGYAPLYARDDGTGWRKHGEKVEFDYIVKTPDGRIVTPGWEDLPWPLGTFNGPPGQLGDVVCPVASAEAQLESKELYQRFRPESRLRDKDISDIAHLRQVIAKQQQKYG